MFTQICNSIITPGCYLLTLLNDLININFICHKSILHFIPLLIVYFIPILRNALLYRNKKMKLLVLNRYIGCIRVLTFTSMDICYKRISIIGKNLYMLMDSISLFFIQRVLMYIHCPDIIHIFNLHTNIVIIMLVFSCT